MNLTMLFRILAGVVALGMLVVGIVLFGAGILSEVLPPRLTVSTIDAGEFGNVAVTHTQADARGLVVLVTDEASLPTRDADVTALARAGLIVVPLDWNDVRQKLTGPSVTDPCAYVSETLNNLARDVERELRVERYFYPVIVGRGEAAAFAYVALAQAPVHTLGGAISIGFKPAIRSDIPYCLDPPLPAAVDGVFALPKPTAPFTDAWRVIGPHRARGRIQEFQSELDKAKFVPATTEHAVRSALVSNAVELGRVRDRGAAGLPVSIIEPAGKAKALAVVISGDGGWRDLDRQLGARLAERDVAVVGLDSLLYFWAKRQPRELAADIGLLFDHYGRQFGVDRFILIGFSFGADVIPGSWPFISADIRDKVALVSLLALGLTADYEVSLEGFLSAGTSTGQPLPPLLAGLPLDRTQCIYGKDDAADGDSSCPAKELGEAQRIALEGGHHFDQNYAHLADLILQRLEPAAP